eukprot:scaffold9049_cov71-Phaeocystis_antarctica.AAC.2
MWKTRRLRPRPCSWLSGGPFRGQIVPQAASLGQSAAWAALAGHTGLVFHIGGSRGRTSGRRSTWKVKLAGQTQRDRRLWRRLDRAAEAVAGRSVGRPLPGSAELPRAATGAP